MRGEVAAPWRAGGERLAICPIGWVNRYLGWGDAYGGERVMDEIAALGYAASEMSAVFPQDPIELREALARRGLVLSAAYRWVNFAYAERLESELEDAERHVDFCVAAGASVVNLAEAGHSVWDARGPQERVTPFDTGQWRRLAACFDQVGAYAAERGVTLAVHPHGGTAIETPSETLRLFELTDPELVGYCLDTGHVAYGGGDAGSMARQLAERVRYVHLKDVRLDVLGSLRRRAMAEGGSPRVGEPTGAAGSASLSRLGVAFKQAVQAHLFCPPGAGDLDFDPVVEALRGAGYDGWYVVEAEQDPLVHEPMAVSALARSFLQGRFGLA